MEEYEYTLEIETLKVLESYHAPSVRQMHELINLKLSELYIAYDKKSFISLRSMQRHMMKTKTNDYHVYKCENSLIKLFKYKSSLTLEEETKQYA